MNLLELVDIKFPSLEKVLNSFQGTRSIGLDNDKARNGAAAWLEAALLGASVSLVASPCSSPVLAALLTFISASSSSSGTFGALSGALLLLLFSAGYATPVVSAGLLTAISPAASSSTSSALDPVLSLSRTGAKSFGWSTSVLAGLLIAYGTYSSLGSAREILGI